MVRLRILFRLGGFGVVTALLAACAGPTLVADGLSADGAPGTEFPASAESVTLTARFDGRPGGGDPVVVEWRFPDGRTYLRKPVRVDGGGAVETSMPVRGKAPARHPGIWHVSLSRGGERLVERSFAIREQAPGTDGFAALVHCGPARWEDPVISARRAPHASSGAPGAWIGKALLDAAGATYSASVLLGGCAPS